MAVKVALVMAFVAAILTFGISFVAVMSVLNNASVTNLLSAALISTVPCSIAGFFVFRFKRNSLADRSTLKNELFAFSFLLLILVLILIVLIGVALAFSQGSAFSTSE